MTTALHALEPRGLDPSPRPVFEATHHWRSTISTPKVAKARTQLNKLRLNNSQQVARLQDSNGPVPTALRRHPPTRPAASASSSQLPSNQAGRQLHRQADHLL